jgi:hypothetical protein
LFRIGVDSLSARADTPITHLTNAIHKAWLGILTFVGVPFPVILAYIHNGVGGSLYSFYFTFIFGSSSWCFRRDGYNGATNPRGPYTLLRLL